MKYSGINNLCGGIQKLIENNEERLTKTYVIKASTVRMINELRAAHPNINVRISTIVDDAIRHYYEHIKEKGGFSQ